MGFRNFRREWSCLLQHNRLNDCRHIAHRYFKRRNVFTAELNEALEALDGLEVSPEEKRGFVEEIAVGIKGGIEGLPKPLTAALAKYGSDEAICGFSSKCDEALLKDLIIACIAHGRDEELIESLVNRFEDCRNFGHDRTNEVRLRQLAEAIKGLPDDTPSKSHFKGEVTRKRLMIVRERLRKEREAEGPKKPNEFYTYKFYHGESENPYTTDTTDDFSRHLFWDYEKALATSNGLSWVARYLFDTTLPTDWPLFIKGAKANAAEREIALIMFEDYNRHQNGGTPREKSWEHSFGVQPHEINWRLYFGEDA